MYLLSTFEEVLLLLEQSTSRSSKTVGRWYTKGAPQQSQGRQPDKGVDGEIEVLYKGRWMLPFRVLVRLKMFQLGGVAACAVPLGTLLTEVRPPPPRM